MVQNEAGTGTFYGKITFDPWIIVGQIITLQCLFYLSLATFLEISVGSEALTLGTFFDFKAVTTSTAKGWLTIVAFCCAALAGSGFLCVVIGRAKKCLDFTATVYFVHFVNCTVYSGFPSGVAWWALTTCSIVVMAMLGECLCFQRELREIPLSRVHQNL